MTWQAIDDSRLADDETLSAWHWTTLYTNLLDTAENRTLGGAHWLTSETNRQPTASAPSDSYRSIPFIVPVRRGCTTLSAKLAFTMNAGSSGIGAGVKGATAWLAVVGSMTVGDPVDIDIGDTSAILSCATPGNWATRWALCEVRIQCERGASAGTFVCEGFQGNTMLALNTGTAAPSASAAPHMEIVPPATRTTGPQVVHLEYAEDRKNGYTGYKLVVWPRPEGEDLPTFGQGDTETWDAYHLPTITLKGLAWAWARDDRDVSVSPVPGYAGRAARAGHPLAIAGATRRLYAGASRIITAGPTAGLNGGTDNTYVWGARAIAPSSPAKIAGGVTVRDADATRVHAAVLWCPMDAAATSQPLALDLTAAAAASATSSMDAYVEGAGAVLRYATSDPGTLVAWSVRGPRNQWSSRDLLAPGDAERLSVAELNVAYPSSVGSEHSVILEATHPAAWIGAVCLWDHVEV